MAFNIEIGNFRFVVSPILIGGKFVVFEAAGAKLSIPRVIVVLAVDVTERTEK